MLSESFVATLLQAVGMDDLEGHGWGGGDGHVMRGSSWHLS